MRSDILSKQTEDEFIAAGLKSAWEKLKDIVTDPVKKYAQAGLFSTEAKANAFLRSAASN